MELEEIIEELRSAGVGELDLDFTVDSLAGRRLRVLPSDAEQGLVALAKAVRHGASKVSVRGDDNGCELGYDRIQIPLGAGALTAIVRRGIFAPVELTVNGLRLGHLKAQSLFETTIPPKGDILGGSVALLPSHQRGLVVLVDRGVSFSLGALFGATRVIAQVTPRRGNPWPSNLTLDRALKQILEQILGHCRTLENRAAQQWSGDPNLLERLLKSLQQRRRVGDGQGARLLLRRLLQNGARLRKISS